MYVNLQAMKCIYSVVCIIISHVVYISIRIHSKTPKIRIMPRLSSHKTVFFMLFMYEIVASSFN